MARNHPGIPQEIEDSPEDKAEDAREAKKRGISVAAWEGSPEDERQDRRIMKHARHMRAAKATKSNAAKGLHMHRVWRATS